jgi:hypothetical protein
LTTNEPTPIRRRNPQPLILPSNPPTFDKRIDMQIRRTVSQMLYNLMRCEELMNIMTMTQEEFDAFVARVTAEEDA